MKLDKITDSYIDGVKDAIKMIERGVFKGLTFKDSLETLKISLSRTEKQFETEALRRAEKK